MGRTHPLSPPVPFPPLLDTSDTYVAHPQTVTHIQWQTVTLVRRFLLSLRGGRRHSVYPRTLQSACASQLPTSRENDNALGKGPPAWDTPVSLGTGLRRGRACFLLPCNPRHIFFEVSEIEEVRTRTAKKTPAAIQDSIIEVPHRVGGFLRRKHAYSLDSSKHRLPSGICF